MLREKGEGARLAQQLERVLRHERGTPSLVHGVRGQRLQREAHRKRGARVAAAVLQRIEGVQAQQASVLGCCCCPAGNWESADTGGRLLQEGFSQIVTCDDG
jgi:hypothetical protein